MKKLFFLMTLALSLFICLPQVQAAPDIGLGQNGLAGKVADKAGYDAGASDTALSETVGKVIKAILSLTGIIFLALTVYAGALWMTARGAEEQITKSKSILTAAVIGLAITLSAYAITVFVVDKLTQSTSGAAVGTSDTAGGPLECGSPQLRDSHCVPPQMIESATQLVEEGLCPDGLVCAEQF